MFMNERSAAERFVPTSLPAHRSWDATDLLAAIIESSDDAIVTEDLEGRITSWNRAAERIFGYTAQEAIGRHISMLLPPERRGEDEEVLAKVRRGERVSGYETVRVSRGGWRREISLTAAPLRDGQGRVVGASRIARDLTERGRGERSRLLLAAVVESSDDAIISKDLEGRITSWNGAAERLYGYTAEEAIGRNVSILIPPDRREEEPEILRRIMRGERVDHYETVRLAKDGRRIDVSLTVSPVRDERGRIVGASKIARDITQQKINERMLVQHRDHLNELVEQRTAELEASREKLRQSERLAAMGTLAAGLGHNIGNLLLPVRSRLDALEGAVGPEHAEDLAAIREATKYLGQLARGLRLLARAGSEDAAQQSETTALAEWWSEVAALMRTALPREVVLRSLIGSGLPPVMIVRSALTQAVFNLVQNAGDAMRPRGTGTVEVRAEPGADGRRVRLTVADDGPGMSGEVLARCLEPFFTTKTRGISTGLGLSLAKGIAQRAGGDLAVESEPGRGTTIVIELPAAAPAGREGGLPIAAVTVAETRVSSFIASVLSSRGFDVVDGEPPPPGAVLWVTDARHHGDLRQLSAFLEADERRHIVLYGPAPEGINGPRLVTAAEPFRPAALRDLVLGAARAATVR